jgi:hypothetical protein
MNMTTPVFPCPVDLDAVHSWPTTPTTPREQMKKHYIEHICTDANKELLGKMILRHRT